MKHDKSKEYLLKKIEDIAARALEKSKEHPSIQQEVKAEQNEIIKLPACKDSERTIPNIIARSALFGVIRRGARPYKNKELIASREDIKVYYSGKALDQADCTVWMQALAFSSVLGRDTPVNRASFLKLLGKTTGKKDYLWLDASLHRLMTSVVTVYTPKYNLEFHLIDTWGKFKDEEHTNEYYLLNVSPRVIKMWANSEYTRVEWDKRLAIKRGCDLASWMQIYIRSNSVTGQPHYISLKKLQNWCGLSNMRLRQYRMAMTKALNELVRVGEIENARINEKDVVTFLRIFNRDSNAPDRDSNAPNHRDSNAPNHRDSNAPNHRDSNAQNRDSNAQNRDSNAQNRDSNAGWPCKILNIKSFFGYFFS